MMCKLNFTFISISCTVFILRRCEVARSMRIDAAVKETTLHVGALDLRSTDRGFKSYSGQKLRNNLGQVVHT